MNALGRNDTPRPDHGLTVCFNFSSDMCRAAVGGSLEAFLQYARNPTFSQLVNHASWDGEVGSRIPATQTRGALTTEMVTVETGDGRTKKFLWTMQQPVPKSNLFGAQPLCLRHRQQQRRPPLTGCWLVHECLAVDNAVQQTL